MQCRIRKLTFFEIRDYIAYTLLAPDFTLNYIRAIHREIQKMTYTALFPMIVEEILSLNALSHHHIKKTLITIHDIKNNAVTTDSLKVFPCAVYLRFLNRTQLHRGHRALGFSCKINMLYLSPYRKQLPSQDYNFLPVSKYRIHSAILHIRPHLCSCPVPQQNFAHWWNQKQDNRTNASLF